MVATGKSSPFESLIAPFRWANATLPIQWLIILYGLIGWAIIMSAIPLIDRAAPASDPYSRFTPAAVDEKKPEARPTPVARPAPVPRPLHPRPVRQIPLDPLLAEPVDRSPARVAEIERMRRSYQEELRIPHPNDAAYPADEHKGATLRILDER